MSIIPKKLHCFFSNVTKIDEVLLQNQKIMETWQCVKQCGACCHLDPSDRPDLEDYLSPDELKHYLAMVGEDGWCIHFAQLTRQCQIYEERPRFCRVKPDTFEQMFQIDPSEFNEFAINCCRQQIEGVYGENSPEMDRYNHAIQH